MLTKLLPVVLVAACGQVEGFEDPPIAPAPSPGDHADLDQIGIDPADRALPIPESPLLVDAPAAATTAASLFGMSVRDHARMVSLIDATATPSTDILEQKVVTKTDAPVELVVELSAPRGTYARVISSSTIRNQYPTAERVLCATGQIATFDPRCERATPAPHTTPSAGPIAASRWRVWVMDAQTGAAVTGCEVLGTRLACTLPGRAVAGYRIMASANGFIELWGLPSNPSVRSLDGREFAGATDREHMCWDMAPVGSNTYCLTRYDYTRYTAIDRAVLELEPISVTITANGITATQDSPALAWDSGDDDLPGAEY